MAQSKSGAKARAKRPAPAKTAGKSTARKPAAGASSKADAKAKGAEEARIAKAKQLEELDAAGVGKKPVKKAGAKPAKTVAKAIAQVVAPMRNSDFPRTYIKQVSVSLNDPDHTVTLTWTGPDAAGHETGPFRSSPGAGMRGLNCDDTATSRRNGSKCTPKGTFTVSGFAAHLNSDSRATFVTWFVRERGIATHYFPSVPTFAASHGCVRIELKRIAQLIQSNSRVGLTKIVVDGTWTKPAHQY